MGDTLEMKFPPASTKKIDEFTKGFSYEFL